MELPVNTAHKDAIIHLMAQVIAQGQYSTADVLIGVSEFLGRMIVNLAETPVAGLHAAQVMEEHIKTTMVAGYTAKGYNMGGDLQ